ncbi:Uncharacterized protein Rs2_34178 [Raphanus sativus]|nr:Uncharacterized protein Rs2_34178 [Raphanus sativus]
MKKAHQALTLNSPADTCVHQLFQLTSSLVYLESSLEASEQTLSSLEYKDQDQFALILSGTKIEEPSACFFLDAGKASGRRRRVYCSGICLSPSSAQSSKILALYSPPSHALFSMSLFRFLTGFLVVLLIVTASVQIVVTSTPAAVTVQIHSENYDSRRRRHHPYPSPAPLTAVAPPPRVYISPHLGRFFISRVLVPPLFCITALPNRKEAPRILLVWRHDCSNGACLVHHAI